MKRSQQSVLRQPQGPRQNPHVQDHAAAPNAGMVDDQNLPSPEAEREVERGAEHEFSGPIRDLPQAKHGHDDAYHNGYTHHSPPPPSPTTSDTRPRSIGPSQESLQGYHITADVYADPGCDDHNDDDHRGESGAGAAAAEDTGSIQAHNSRQEEELDEATAAVSEVDGASVGISGGSRLVREV
eukprot:COSAG02_NODE_1960_length_10257_cov_48.153278_5_plen_183_part_00